MKRPSRFLCALLLSATATMTAATGCGKEAVETDSAEKLAKDLKEAETRLRNNMLEDAQKIYVRVLEAHPDNADALGGLGQVRWEQKKFDEAEKYLAKAVATKTDDAELQGTLGAVYAHQEKHPEAAEAYGKAWKLDGENSEFGLAYGKQLKAIEKYDEAETVLREVMDLDPEVKYVYTELADVLRAKGKLPEALKMYMKAQNTHRSDTMARAGTALLYEEQGEISLALDEWSAYIRMDCCSDYSKNVARKKVMELEVPGGDAEAAPADGDEEAAPDGDADSPADGGDEGHASAGSAHDAPKDGGDDAADDDAPE
jgi:tetratricopeptide (TPR) repeat protein